MVSGLCKVLTFLPGKHDLATLEAVYQHVLQG